MIDARVTSSSMWMLMTFVAACTGHLSVKTGELEPTDGATPAPDGVTPAPDSATPTEGAPPDAGACETCGVVPSPCNCASSSGLLPIACGVTAGQGHRGPFLDSAGIAMAIDLCNDSGCDPFYWMLAQRAQPLGSGGRVSGLSANVDVVLIDQTRDEHTHGPYLVSIAGSAVLLPFVSAFALADDGKTVLGLLESPYGQFARWTPAGGTVPLGTQTFYSGMPLMTPDGAFVVGLRDDTGDSGLIRWSADGSELALGSISSEAMYPSVAAISRDGAAIAVTASVGDSLQVFRWTQDSGFWPVAPIGTEGRAIRLVGDGSMLFGTYRAEGGSGVVPNAFRWTPASGVVPLAGAPERGSVLADTNANGTTAVGFTFEGSRTPPFVWDENNGIRPIRWLLQLASVDLAGWELGAPLAISPNGRVVFGEGTCGGSPAIYRVVLP